MNNSKTLKIQSVHTYFQDFLNFNHVPSFDSKCFLCWTHLDKSYNFGRELSWIGFFHRILLAFLESLLLKGCPNFLWINNLESWKRFVLIPYLVPKKVLGGMKWQTVAVSLADHTLNFMATFKFTLCLPVWKGDGIWERFQVWLTECLKWFP